MGTAYTWKTSFMKVSAEVAGKEFERIEREMGLTAQAVVDESRAEDAPLHDAFEWNDAIAGEEWRKQQARVMIQNLVINIEEKPEAPKVRAFIKLEESAVYENTQVILKEEDKRKAAFRMAMRELMSFRKKYAELTEFAAIFDEIDRLTEVAE